MQSNELTMLFSSIKLPPEMAPGDEAPAGTPGTGENVCRMCGGTGRVDGHPCTDCEGSGKVNDGIGGA
ncbi:MAG: hypothetical protein H7X75_08390 [Burkholderiaceae bacterium]|nr:hypothetical protein [Burkholderiaceae bacterium]